MHPSRAHTAVNRALSAPPIRPLHRSCPNPHLPCYRLILLYTSPPLVPLAHCSLVTPHSSLPLNSNPLKPTKNPRRALESWFLALFPPTIQTQSHPAARIFIGA